MSNSEKIEAIKLAAASRFGREAEIFVNDIRVDAVGDRCWQLRQIDDLRKIPKTKENSSFYKLSAMIGDIGNCAIFDFEKGPSEEDIERQLTVLEEDLKEYIEEHVK